MPYNLSALPADADDIKRYLRRDLPCAALPRCPSPRRRHARDVRYVGGFYGNASEEAMLRELANNGPVRRAIQAQKNIYQLLCQKILILTSEEIH